MGEHTNTQALHHQPAGPSKAQKGAEQKAGWIEIG